MRRITFGILALCSGLIGCKSADIGGLNGLSLSATSAVVPPPAENVVATAVITNFTTTAITINYGGCAVTPILHTGGRNGPIAFDPRPTQSCTTAALTKTLNPTESFTISGSAVPSLPAGTYYVEAEIKLNGTTSNLGAGTVTF